MIIGFPTVTDSFVLSGGSYNSNYPISNLTNDDQKKVARTTNVLNASTKIIGSSTTTKNVGILALPNNTMSLAATLRIRLWSSATFTGLLLDTTLSVYPTSEIFKNDFFYCDGNNYAIKSFEIDIDDDGNTDGFVDFGYLELAEAIETEFNFRPGGQRGFLHRTTFVQAPGGKKIFNPYGPVKTLVATFDSNDDELMDFYWSFIKTNGIHKSFVIIPDRTETDLTKNSMLCRMTKPNVAAEYIDYLRNQISLDFEEVTD